MARSRPYRTNQETWNTILQKNLQIPMNQREYSWETNEITKFLDDIFNIFEEGKYVEKMGSIINLNYNNNNYIYDGQQRILTTILIINIIGCLSSQLKNQINTLLSINTVLDDLTEAQKKIKEKCNVDIIPKIYCINPYDMKGLVNIFNNKVKPWLYYCSNIDEINSYDEDDNNDDDKSFICNECHTKIGRKSHFIRHITKQHNYVKHEGNTKLYAAFIEIYNYFIMRKYGEQKLINLYKFILNDIDVQFYDFTDPVYVSRIFDQENNRGKTVETLDIIKNPILVQIPDDKKVEVYERWEKLKHVENKIYKTNFGQKIFDVAIQLYNKKITRKINKEDLFKPIIDNENTYKEINKFFVIVEKLFEIMNKISNDKYGRLINNTSRICLNWEAYMWCLLPIFYNTNNINRDLIKLMTKWYFRRIGIKLRGFNPLTYSQEFIKISNKVLNNKDYDYHTDIKECFKKNKEPSIQYDTYISVLRTMVIASTNATYLLLFLETCINPDSHIVPLDYTLEHIYCQKNKSDLKDQSLMNNIGNLTLIEGKNSENGHKGNSALGSKPYKKKTISYKNSNCQTTRTISDTYTVFEEEQIKIRSKEMVDLLNKYTDY
jgi:hypothetical protein